MICWVKILWKLVHHRICRINKSITAWSARLSVFTDGSNAVFASFSRVDKILTSATSGACGKICIDSSNTRFASRRRSRGIRPSIVFATRLTWQLVTTYGTAAGLASSIDSAKVLALIAWSAGLFVIANGSGTNNTFFCCSVKNVDSSTGGTFGVSCIHVTNAVCAFGVDHVLARIAHYASKFVCGDCSSAGSAFATVEVVFVSTRLANATLYVSDTDTSFIVLQGELLVASIASTRV